MTLTVRPEGDPDDPDSCGDDADPPPKAIVERNGFGLAADAGTVVVEGVGEDGEADIALCRTGSNLARVSLEGHFN